MFNKQNDYDKQNVDPGISLEARSRDSVTQLNFAKTFLNESCTEAEYIHGFNLILQSAKQGNMVAQFRLGDLYALSQEIQERQANAYQWYTKAALQGYKKALVRIRNLYLQDKRMYCRGQLNSSEKEWADENFKKEHNIRELNEYRRGQHAPMLNNAVDYYTRQFKYYKSPKEENIESDLNLAFLYQYGYGTKKNRLLAVDFYKKAAEKGHKDAQYGLAYLYQTSAGIKFHYWLALRWYRASATNGNIAAQNRLAYFYEKGLATELSYEGALYWYTKAANAGSSSAQLTLGRLYRNGEGIEKNISEAIKWYKLAADQGNNAARNCLNQLYLAQEIPSSSVSQSSATFTLRSKLQRDIIDLNDSVHIKKLKILAQHAFMTDGNAMYQIGLKYYNGEDFSQDKGIGFQWIKKAAKAGIEEAELKVARMYEDGDAVDQDYHKSSIWTIKSAKKKNNTALLKLGILYKNGFGVRKDPLEASKWFTISANRGNTHAQFQYGLSRYNGEGVREDKKEGFEYFYKSALLGNGDALYQLGWMCENNGFSGSDIDKALKIYRATENAKFYGPVEAFRFYKSAAKLGSQDAQFRLARIYEEGKLTRKDLVKAHEYYTMAANSNNPHYQTKLALKYINGDFDDDRYIKAFDLFKNAAKKNETRATRIFQIPIQLSDDINDYSRVIDMFIFASTQGEDRIQFNIGYAYEHGIMLNDKMIFKRNYKDSRLWYLIAAKEGDSRAKCKVDIICEMDKIANKYQNFDSHFQFLTYHYGIGDIAYNLALKYFYGDLVSRDLIKSFNLFTAAYNMGYKEAHEKLVISGESENMAMLEAVANYGNVGIQYQLGIYFENRGDSKSIKWLMLAAEGGSNNAYYRLGVLCEEGRVTPTDYSKAIVSYEKAIEQDHEDALYRLAQIYRYGRGIEHNYLKAYELYRKAANIGHTGALKILNLNEKQNSLSHQKSNEESHTYSSDELTSIVSMLEFVAEQGNVDLQFELGYFYENNKDKQNYSKALKWYTMAAASNHTEAMYRLGSIYEDGLGVLQNYNMSIQLYRQAKVQGNHCALYRLGIAFQHGYGVEKNFTEAISFYSKAARLGNGDAQYTLGKIYDEGEVIQRDIIKALAFYTNAYMNGNIDDVPSLRRLYDYQPYESFFHQRLFRIFSCLEKITKPNSVDYQAIYGSMYYRLGKMYLEGAVTEINDKQALKMFLIAENKYGYRRAKPFTERIYDHNKEKIDDYKKRMKTYFEIKDFLDSELQYKLGMLYYEDGKYYYEKDEKKKKKATISLLVSSKEDDTAFQYLLLASKNKHTKAQIQIESMYRLGCGVEKNEDKAIEYTKKFIETIEPSQCYKLGMAFYNGNGVSQNYKISFIYINRAAKENDSRAQHILGMMYCYGYGVQQDQGESTKWIQQSIKKMTGRECYERGMEFYQGKKADENYKIAFLYIKKAAEENDRMAKAQLGSMYFYGHGVEQNQEEAMKWIQQSIKEMRGFECYTQGMKFYIDNKADKRYEIALLYLQKAFEKNHCEAQAQLGIMHFHGYGVDQNREKAMQLLEESAKKMVGCDLYKLGMKCYRDIEIDDAIALLYLEKAAKDNYEDARAQLGLMYSNGRGVEKNLNKAMEWIESSVKNMMPHRCYNHGIQFFNCNKIDQHYQFSLIYFKKAAEKNHVYSQAQLGCMYLNGYGVKQDSDEASQWYSKVIRKYSGQPIYKIGQIYHYDSGGIQDFSKAFEFYHRESGNTDKGYALHGIGLLYEYGDGVSQDYEKASEYYRQSTESSNIGGYFSRGLLFYRGRSVNQEYDTAYLLFSKVLKIVSNSEEMYVFIEDIDVDSKNGTTGLTRYKHSLVTSDRICGEAHYYMGLMCENGQGRHKNEKEARMHFEKAFERGVQRAEFFLK